MGYPGSGVPSRVGQSDVLGTRRSPMMPRTSPALHRGELKSTDEDWNLLAKASRFAANGYSVFCATISSSIGTISSWIFLPRVRPTRPRLYVDHTRRLKGCKQLIARRYSLPTLCWYSRALRDWEELQMRRYVFCNLHHNTQRDL